MDYGVYQPRLVFKSGITLGIRNAWINYLIGLGFASRYSIRKVRKERELIVVVSKIVY